MVRKIIYYPQPRIPSMFKLNSLMEKNEEGETKDKIEKVRIEREQITGQ